MLLSCVCDVYITEWQRITFVILQKLIYLSYLPTQCKLLVRLVGLIEMYEKRIFHKFNEFSYKTMS